MNKIIEIKHLCKSFGDIKAVDDIKSELGVVFQSSVLDSALSVYDNLESRAALYGIVGKEFKEK